MTSHVGLLSIAKSNNNNIVLNANQLFLPLNTSSNADKRMLVLLYTNSSNSSNNSIQ